MSQTKAVPEQYEHVAAVADNFVGLMRSFNRARDRMLAAAADDVEWSSHILLNVLRKGGPMRAGAIAEGLQSDPSTVSRQVAALVRDGLVERRADPDDGRASLLVLTAKADGVLAEHDQRRLEFFATVLDGWTDADVRRFADQLGRFSEAYEAASTDWNNERPAQRATRAGSTH